MSNYILSTTYRPEIDGLRALAVIAVIVNHFNPALLPTGFLGVDIFFVISGYVITSSLHNRPDQSWKDYIQGFYARRIKRIVPALAICVLLTSLAGSLFISPQASGFSTSIRTGIASLSACSNIYLLRKSIDYFGSAAELNLFTHTWSLGVEEQFYLVFPLILGFCGFSRRKTINGMRNSVIVILGLSIFSLIFYIYIAHTKPIYAFFIMPLRFWELGIGCIAFLFAQRSLQPTLNQNKPWVSSVSLLLLIASLFISEDHQTSASIAVCILSAVAIGAVDQISTIGLIFSSKLFVYIGRISYSLYLWHWSILVISRWTIGISEYTIPFQLLAIFILALASYHWIEKPLRYTKWGKHESITIRYGLGILLVSMLLLIGLSTGKIYLGTNPKASHQQANLPPPQAICQFDRGLLNNNFLRFCGFNLKRSFKANSNIGASKIFLLGDSHARMILNLIEDYAKSRQIRLAFSYGASCPIPSFSTNLSTECLSRSKVIEELLFKLVKPGDLVIISNSFEGYGLTTREPNYYKKVEFARKVIDLFAKKLARSGAKLLIFGVKPRYWNILDGNICVTEWFKPRFRLFADCALEKEKELSIRSQLIEKFTDIQQENSNVTVINLFNYFCPGKYCHLYDEENNELLYSDSHHINHTQFLVRKSEFELLLDLLF